MAKNLFEELLTKANEIWTGSKPHYDQKVYREESTDSGLSGVAKYLAKQDKALQPVEETSSSKQLTGVEKYLAKQQGVVASISDVSSAPKTSVEKYLARQGGSSAASPAPAAVKEPEPIVVPKTGVGKYLAGVPLSSGSKAATASTSTQTSKTGSAATKATQPAQKPTPAKSVVPSESSYQGEAQKSEDSSSAPSQGKSFAQCHASTSKGTQCKNTTHLTKIQRTVNKKRYQFAACKQHNNDSFKPYQPLLEAN